MVTNKIDGVGCGADERTRASNSTELPKGDGSVGWPRAAVCLFSWGLMVMVLAVSVGMLLDRHVFNLNMDGMGPGEVAMWCHWQLYGKLWLGGLMVLLAALPACWFAGHRKHLYSVLRRPLESILVLLCVVMLASGFGWPPLHQAGVDRVKASLHGSILNMDQLHEATRRFQVVTGRWPDTLAELHPAYISERRVFFPPRVWPPVADTLDTGYVYMGDALERGGGSVLGEKPGTNWGEGGFVMDVENNYSWVPENQLVRLSHAALGSTKEVGREN